MLAMIAISLLLGALVQADGLSVEEWEQLNAATTAMLHEHSQLVAAGEMPPIKCGTPIINGLQMTRPKDAISKVLYFEREDSMSFAYGTDHFKIHYTDNGINRPWQYSVQNLDPPHPDYIVQMGQILEEVYLHMSVDLGYPDPKSDGFYNGGGDARMDVYVVDFPYYGATAIDRLLGDGTSTAYMFMENDYQGPGFEGYVNRPLPAVRVTAAHEFFHTIQFGIDVYEYENLGGGDISAAWIEMSAVFMEEEHYDDVNDYYGYLPYFYDFPQWSIRTGSKSILLRNYHMYGSVLFPIFLAENFGVGIIKDIWNRCGQQIGANWWLAADDAIKANSNDTLDMQTMFREFSLWNLFTKNRAQPGNYFEEAEYYNAVSIVENVYSYPASISIPYDSLKPDNLGANYIFLNSLSTLASDLLINFNPDNSQPWGLQIVGFPASGPPEVFDVTLNDLTSTQIIIPNAADFVNIALIPSVLGGNATEVDYSITVSPPEEGIIKPNGGEIWYADETYEITWFFSDTVTSVKIELSRDSGQTWSTLFDQTENDLFQEWTVTDTASDLCLMKISNFDNPDQYDISDSVFSIVISTDDVVVYPNPAWVHMYDRELHFRGKYSIIEFPEGTTMTVKVMTLAGERIWEKSESSSSGGIVIDWDYKNEYGEMVAAGPYMAIITLGDETVVKKFVVLR